MIARITNIAVAVTITILGFAQSTAQAQEGPPAATDAAGILAADCGCADAGCTGCADPSCDGEWLSTRRLGLQHHPNCSCPRCHPRPTWASFEALMWWGKGRSTPPLVSDGILPAASVLFGGGTVGSEMAGGARADFGFWFDDCETLGIGAKVWGLAGDSDGYEASSSDAPGLARPFFDWRLGPLGEQALLVDHVNVETSTSILSAETYLRSGVLAGRGYSVDLVGGYHFLRLDDELSVFSTTPAFGSPPVDMLDNFNAHNEFHGGSIGLASEVRHGRWTVASLAKISVGNMHQSVRIAGSNSNAGTGGMLALPTNMGEYTNDATAWIPEIGVTAGYDVRNWMRLTIGYNFLWMSNVALAGDQIDYNLNASQFAGGIRLGDPLPAFAFQEDEYWLHGLTLGATLMY